MRRKQTSGEISIIDAIRTLRVSERRVRQLIQEGELDRADGRAITRASLDAYVERKRQREELRNRIVELEAEIQSCKEQLRPA